MQLICQPTVFERYDKWEVEEEVVPVGFPFEVENEEGIEAGAKARVEAGAEEVIIEGTEAWNETCTEAGNQTWTEAGNQTTCMVDRTTPASLHWNIILHLLHVFFVDYMYRT